MKKASVLTIIVCLLAAANVTLADTFGTGDNQFAIDFVTISGDASSANGTNINQRGYGYKKFTDPGDYRMGKFEITNDQWNKFKAAYGPVAGSPTVAYDANPYFTGANVPTNNVSWYEATQFVNWLNTSTGHQTAYKFTGTQGTSNYTFSAWQSGDEGYNASNPYRNSNAYYFLPTDSEWVKAAYWNGTSLQQYATKAGETVFQGNGNNGGWNYGHVNPLGNPWAVGSGSGELNGTFDMMGNVWEWMEDSDNPSNYSPGAYHGFRGGSFSGSIIYFDSFYGGYAFLPYTEDGGYGFRVASIPEPASLLLLGLGGLMLRRKK